MTTGVMNVSVARCGIIIYPGRSVHVCMKYVKGGQVCGCGWMRYAAFFPM